MNFVLPSLVISLLSPLISLQNRQKCRFEPTLKKCSRNKTLWAKKPDFMRLLAQTRQPETDTKRPEVDTLTKRLEMLCSQKEPRVRIPNSPPKSPVTKRFSGLLFFVHFRKIASKPPQEQPDFRKELRVFCLFRRIRTVKLGSFRLHINFRSIYCRNSPFRATPFRLP